MRLAFAVALVAACGPDLDAPATLPVAQGAGPFRVPFGASPVYAGQTTTLSVSGLPTGARVTFLRSERGAGAGPCHPSLPACAGVLAPLTVLGTATVATGGIASIPWAVPGGTTVPQWLQAFVSLPGTTLAATSAVLVRVPGDGDLDFVPDAQDNCVDGPNPDQLDADGDTFGEACDCDDVDGAIHPDAAEVPHNPVDEDCDGVAEDAWAGTWSGTATGTVQMFGFGDSCSGSLNFSVSDDPAVLSGAATCTGPFLGPVALTIDGTVSGAVFTGTATSVLAPVPLTGTFAEAGGVLTFEAEGSAPGVQLSLQASSL